LEGDSCLGLVRNALGLNGTPMRVPLFPSAQVGWNSEAQFRVGLDVLDGASATVRGRKSFQEAAKEGCRAEQGSVYSDLPAKPRSRFQKDEMGIPFEMTSRVGIACSCPPKEKLGKSRESSRRLYRIRLLYIHTCHRDTDEADRFSDAAAPRHRGGLISAMQRFYFQHALAGESAAEWQLLSHSQ
jgi:hypothetical protein